MSISFITSKTFPQKLIVSPDAISEIVFSPVTAIDNSPLLSDNQDILDIIVDHEPAKVALEISRLLSKIEDIFKSKVEEDKRLTSQVRSLSTRVGYIRPSTEEEDEQDTVEDLDELARKALENARKNKKK